MRAFLLAHFKWHRKLRMKTADDYPVTITKKHYYHVSDGISYMDLFSEQDVADTVTDEASNSAKQRKRISSDVTRTAPTAGGIKISTVLSDG